MSGTTPLCLTQPPRFRTCLLNVAGRIRRNVAWFVWLAWGCFPATIVRRLLYLCLCVPLSFCRPAFLTRAVAIVAIWTQSWHSAAWAVKHNVFISGMLCRSLLVITSKLRHSIPEMNILCFTAQAALCHYTPDCPFFFFFFCCPFFFLGIQLPLTWTSWPVCLAGLGVLPRYI